jgi:tetratricopeptide (TPR) repeat protein
MSESEKLSSQLVEAFNGRDWRRAEMLSGQLLALQPEHAGAHYIAGIAYLELRHMPKALTHLYLATQCAPLQVSFHAAYAKALAIARLSSQALAAAERALAMSPHDAATLDMLGVAFTLNNAHARAAEVFRMAVQLDPADAHGQYNLGTSLMFTGDMGGAEAALEACIALAPTYWMAHATLSQLRRQTPSHNHVERVSALLEKHAHLSEAREQLGLALAKEYEDLGNYADAFGYLKRSKALIKSRSHYTAAQDEALFTALLDVTATPPVAGQGCMTDEPIFVIGMPRSGTTLVERILSSHGDVSSAGELQHFGSALKRLSGSRTPITLDAETVAAARMMDWRRLGETYLASTRPLTGRRPQFVDKLPHNFLYVGFIAQALPAAKIICVRRNPMDTCLSNFRQMFAESSPFHGYALDLLDTGRYFVWFDQLMKHWQRQFPGRILEVAYEHLVEAQEDETRRMLDFCQLPWDSRCMAFESNRAPVATASAVQVREPMYRLAVNRWKRYGADLDDLNQLLTAAGIDTQA